VAGLAAMALTSTLGSAMGLNFVGTFMFGCVGFVSVALWVEARIARRRRSPAPLDSPMDAASPGDRSEGGRE
jgi:hypothetical protein